MQKKEPRSIRKKSRRACRLAKNRIPAIPAAGMVKSRVHYTGIRLKNTVMKLINGTHSGTWKGYAQVSPLERTDRFIPVWLQYKQVKKCLPGGKNTGAHSI